MTSSRALNTEETDREEPTEQNYLKRAIRITAVVGLVAVIVIAFTVFDAEKELEDLLEWIDKHETPGFFIFVLAYILTTGNLFQPYGLDNGVQTSCLET